MYKNNGAITDASLCRVRKGSWSEEEDDLLRRCIQKYGEGNWKRVPQRAGLNRCRKSCRWRWLNYLKPSVKRGNFNEDEVEFIIRQHKLIGNRWSLIAARLPGRTINDVKNYCNTLIYKTMLLKTNSNAQNADNINQSWASQVESFSHSTSPKPAASTEFNGPNPSIVGTVETILDAEEENQDLSTLWETFLEEGQRDERENSQNINGPILWQEEPNCSEQMDNWLFTLSENPNKPHGDGEYMYEWEEDLSELEVPPWE